MLLVWEDRRRRLVFVTCLIKQLIALICSTPYAQLVKLHSEDEIVPSPVRCSEVGVTRHLLKKASVSGSTTSSRVSCPPALMAATTSECVLPSTNILFTWRRQKEEKKRERDVRRMRWMRYLNFAARLQTLQNMTKKKSSLLLFVVVHLHSHTEVNKLHHCQELFFFLNIIGLFAKGSRAGNPVCPRTIAHAQTFNKESWNFPLSLIYMSVYIYKFCYYVTVTVAL